MAVASFLVKDLMINWKEGERIFSRNLIDGDLGSNNAGWQWSASTGTDPQPYFRIFNPINQGEKFDPDGDYIRYYVPELSHVKGKGEARTAILYTVEGEHEVILTFSNVLSHSRTTQAPQDLGVQGDRLSQADCRSRSGPQEGDSKIQEVSPMEHTSHT